MTEIKNIFSEVIYTSANDDDTIKQALEQAVKAGVSLHKADLRGADLEGADLWGADLRDADLRDADLGGAQLTGANLQGADLTGANLWGADLTGANLQGVDLTGANLWGVNLEGADLEGAKITTGSKTFTLDKLEESMESGETIKLCTLKADEVVTAERISSAMAKQGHPMAIAVGDWMFADETKEPTDD